MLYSVIFIFISTQLPCMYSNYNITNVTEIETNPSPEIQRSVDDPETTTFDQNITSTLTTDEEVDEDVLSWLPEAIQDIAYYLRQHKFNEFDRRYNYNGFKAPRDYFTSFPHPPLRSLHWEVHQYCEESFANCADFLWKKVRQTGLRRVDDTAVQMMEQHWTKSTHFNQIRMLEEECQKLRNTDDHLANPFLGPIERYQWRVSASYYMCWYTMNEVPSLAHFNESCDNYAYCLDREFGAQNSDYRVDDSVPFSCALYSFCPDPCCPQQHYYHEDMCINSQENPCFAENEYEDRECVLQRGENTDFRDIILNRWNVTCNCTQKGYRWDSRYSLCVDVDECMEDLHDCNGESEACLNLSGGFKCSCKWGFSADSENASLCVEDSVLSLIKLNKADENKEEETRKAQSVIKYLYNLMFAEKSEND